jgi:hypothetical protein
VAPELKRRLARIPGAARRSLPALRDLVGVVAVPHLQYAMISREMVAGTHAVVAFRPDWSLAGSGFTVV